MSKSVMHVISVSGGKDSTAVLLAALENCPRESIVPIFCDTGNEHQAVYEYLDYLDLALDIKIKRLKADFSEQIAAKRAFIARDQRTGRDKFGRRLRWTNKAKRRALAVLHPTGIPFLDLCLWKGRFPSRKAQFCTEELKRNIAVEFQLSLIEQGYQVLSWQGIRRGESSARRAAKKSERVGGGALDIQAHCRLDRAGRVCQDRASRPEAHPLYTQGMSRVGCMPCINVNKAELREIAGRFPEHPVRISEWEWLVSQASKRGHSTFLHKGPGENGQKTDRETFAAANIWQAIAWSKTSRGGSINQMDMFMDHELPACASAYGLCDKG